MNKPVMPTTMLPDAAAPLGVQPRMIQSSGRQIGLHVAFAQTDPSHASQAPLVLIHSVNASASVIEMRAFFQRQSQRRAVVALDLPGFGVSDRRPGRYTPGLMARAVQDTLDWTRRHVGSAPADVVALSLSCEFATLAALADPGAMRSLTLISPTGMERRRIGEAYEGGRTRESRLMSRLLNLPGVGRGLYAALISRPAMRWFLARSWGTRHFDEALLEVGRAQAQAAGAHHAPLSFLSGGLFTRGFVSFYRRLAIPVLVAHGRRGAFTDFAAYGHVAAHSPGQWQRRVFATGAMPHLEWPAEFDATYQSWLSSHVLPARALSGTGAASAPQWLGRSANAATAHAPRAMVGVHVATPPLAGSR